jgi:hypothetical protein
MGCQCSVVKVLQTLYTKNCSPVTTQDYVLVSREIFEFKKLFATFVTVNRGQRFFPSYQHTHTRMLGMLWHRQTASEGTGWRPTDAAGPARAGRNAVWDWVSTRYMIVRCDAYCPPTSPSPLMDGRPRA